MSGPLRVIKLGGSLLDWPEWPDHFRRWRAIEPAAVDVLVVGGGALVDGLRRVDRGGALPADTAHWLAIRAMSLTAAIAAELLPGSTLVHLPAELRRSAYAEVQILDVERLLRDDATSRDPLPATWQVTSDSIAARVASTLGAAELVLLKSAPAAVPATSRSLADAGLVDPYFPRAAAGLAVRYVNLRGLPAAAVVA